MCELLGMSANVPSVFVFSSTGLMRPAPISRPSSLAVSADQTAAMPVSLPFPGR